MRPPSPLREADPLAVRAILPVATPASVRTHVAHLLRRHRRTLVVLVVLQALAAAAALVGPQVLAIIVTGLTNGTATTSLITWSAAVFAAALVAQTAFTGWARLRGAILGESVLADLREDFVEDAVHLPPSVVESAGTGDLVTRATTDVDRLSWAVRHAVPEIIIALVTAALVLVALIVTSPVLALTWLLAVPPIVLGSRWYFRRAPAAYAAEMAGYAAVQGTIAESADAGRTIETYRLGGRRIEQTESGIKHWVSWERFTLYLRSVWFPTIETGYILPLAAVLAIGGVLTVQGTIDIGQLTAAALYAQMLIEPIDMLLMWYDELQVGQASLARLIGVGQVPRHVGDDTLTPRDEQVSVRGLSFGYRQGHDVLHDIDLEIRPGERLAVVGPSGAGKSTLGRLLAGVHAPRVGSVMVGGIEMTDLPTEVVRRHVCLVTQEHHVFVGSLRDNLRLAHEDADDAALWSALDAVDAQWARDLPDGLDTVVGSGGLELPPAHAQQVALARIVLADPHTLVLDEATSLLDPRSARSLERSLARVLADRTVIAIAHRLYTAHDADRIIVVDHGRILESGTHDELVAADGAYSSLWRSWTTE